MLTVIIAVSVLVHIVMDNRFEYLEDDYRTTITLKSILHTPHNPLTNSTVSNLLTTEDRLMITEATESVLVYLSGGSQRLMFIVVFAVTNINVFTLAKFKALFNSRRHSKVTTNSNVRI